MAASRRSRAIAVGCVLLMAAHTPVVAQNDYLRSGRVVRVEVDAARHEGTLVSVTPGSLGLKRSVPGVINVYDTLTIPQSSISRLWVATAESRHPGPGALIGMLTGVGVGYIIGNSLGLCVPAPEEEDWFGLSCLLSPTTRKGAIQLGMVVGGLGGVVLGAAIGQTWVSRTWQELTPTEAGAGH